MMTVVDEAVPLGGGIYKLRLTSYGWFRRKKSVRTFRRDPKSLIWCDAETADEVPLFDLIPAPAPFYRESAIIKALDAAERREAWGGCRLEG